MREIILIRHVKTKGNTERRYIGSTDEDALFEELERLDPAMYPDCGAVYSSCLKRAAQTAERIYGKRVSVIIYDAGLNELDFGRFEGKNYEELKDDPAYREWIASGGEAAPENGEGMRYFKERTAEAFIRALKNTEDAQRIAIVTHGGVIMALCQKFTGCAFYDTQINAGEGVILSYDGNKFEKIGEIKNKREKIQ